MNRWKLMMLISLALVIGAVTYGLHQSFPARFPDHDALVRSMNELFPRASVKTIQDTIHVDLHHVYVPFISENGDHGSSFWVWKWFGWKVINIETKGSPLLWKTKGEDPSGQYLTWNLDPRDSLNQIQYYLIQDRYFHISSGIHRYTPRVELSISLSIEEQPFGGLSLPEKWIGILEDTMATEQSHSSSWFFSTDHSMKFGWRPLDHLGNHKYPKHSVHGSGYSDGSFDQEFVFIIDEHELEEYLND